MFSDRPRVRVSNRQPSDVRNMLLETAVSREDLDSLLDLIKHSTKNDVAMYDTVLKALKVIPNSRKWNSYSDSKQKQRSRYATEEENPEESRIYVAGDQSAGKTSIVISLTGAPLSTFSDGKATAILQESSVVYSPESDSTPHSGGNLKNLYNSGGGPNPVCEFKFKDHPSERVLVSNLPDKIESILSHGQDYDFDNEVRVVMKSAKATPTIAITDVPGLTGSLGDVKLQKLLDMQNKLIKRLTDRPGRNMLVLVHAANASMEDSIWKRNLDLKNLSDQNLVLALSKCDRMSVPEIARLAGVAPKIDKTVTSGNHGGFLSFPGASFPEMPSLGTSLKESFTGVSLGTSSLTGVAGSKESSTFVSTGVEKKSPSPGGVEIVSPKLRMSFTALELLKRLERSFVSMGGLSKGTRVFFVASYFGKTLELAHLSVKDRMAEIRRGEDDNINTFRDLFSDEKAWNKQNISLKKMTDCEQREFDSMIGNTSLRRYLREKTMVPHRTIMMKLQKLSQAVTQSTKACDLAIESVEEQLHLIEGNGAVQKVKDFLRKVCDIFFALSQGGVPNSSFAYESYEEGKEEFGITGYDERQIISQMDPSIFNGDKMMTEHEIRQHLNDHGRGYDNLRKIHNVDTWFQRLTCTLVFQLITYSNTDFDLRSLSPAQGIGQQTFNLEQAFHQKLTKVHKEMLDRNGRYAALSASLGTLSQAEAAFQSVIRSRTTDIFAGSNPSLIEEATGKSIENIDLNDDVFVGDRGRRDRQFLHNALDGRRRFNVDAGCDRFDVRNSNMSCRSPNMRENSKNHMFGKSMVRGVSSRGKSLPMPTGCLLDVVERHLTRKDARAVGLLNHRIIHRDSNSGGVNGDGHFRGHDDTLPDAIHVGNQNCRDGVYHADYNPRCDAGLDPLYAWHEEESAESTPQQDVMDILVSVFFTLQLEELLKDFQGLSKVLVATQDSTKAVLLRCLGVFLHNDPEYQSLYRVEKPKSVFQDCMNKETVLKEYCERNEGMKNLDRMKKAELLCDLVLLNDSPDHPHLPDTSGSVNPATLAARSYENKYQTSLSVVCLQFIERVQELLYIRTQDLKRRDKQQHIDSIVDDAYLSLLLGYTEPVKDVWAILNEVIDTLCTHGGRLCNLVTDLKEGLIFHIPSPQGTSVVRTPHGNPQGNDNGGIQSRPNHGEIIQSTPVQTPPRSKTSLNGNRVHVENANTTTTKPSGTPTEPSAHAIGYASSPSCSTVAPQDEPSPTSSSSDDPNVAGNENARNGSSRLDPTSEKQQQSDRQHQESLIQSARQHELDVQHELPRNHDEIARNLTRQDAWQESLKIGALRLCDDIGKLESQSLMYSSLTRAIIREIYASEDGGSYLMKRLRDWRQSLQEGARDACANEVMRLLAKHRYESVSERERLMGEIEHIEKEKQFFATAERSVRSFEKFYRDNGADLLQRLAGNEMKGNE